ncbi:thermonuclease family protein [Haladaptatus halobius]|uniref:thermonuclease family protein n=1 Tax=Haladaptatus halobius TaxID=2884875 RepID=UPI001D0AF299|nr:thermonuclease family protein [Haladaptatus halobius]
MGSSLNRDEEYTVTVTNVSDGDTFDAEFSDGSSEELRIIGVDSPETTQNKEHERPEEWEGIEDLEYLGKWGEKASKFAKETVHKATLTVSFDPNEPIRDQYDRLLVYASYSTDEGEPVLYNKELIQRGYARVYDSGAAKHDELWQAERDAKKQQHGVWKESDPAASSEIRDHDVSTLFFPYTSSIRSESGTIDSKRVPVFAGEQAEQQLNGDKSIEYSNPPLVAVDPDARLGMLGSLFINEEYEKSEEFPVDTSDFGNFVFLINLLTSLSERSKDVLIDGGHGQFAGEASLSAEDVAYYQRYLEGQGGIKFEQNNTLTTEFLDLGRALLITTPVEPFTEDEIETISTFRDDGGAVILLGSAAASTEACKNLNALASGLGSDLRLNDDKITSKNENVNENPELLSTSLFNDSFPLFEAYSKQSTAIESAE